MRVINIQPAFSGRPQQRNVKPVTSGVSRELNEISRNLAGHRRNVAAQAEDRRQRIISAFQSKQRVTR